MSRGARPGERRGGRAKGTPNKRTLERVKAETEMAQKMGRLLVEQLGENCFPGDAHALAQALYKDMTVPIEVRIEAMKAALPYEKPRLTAVEHSGNVGLSHEDRLSLLDKLAQEELKKGDASKYDA